MFVDLVGSTALASRLDPEDLRELFDRFQRAIARAINGFDGRISSCQGDGVLACFGWPQSHEDDAEQAVRAGLAAVEAVGQLQVSCAETLACRVGIATGLVVVGAPASGSDGFAVVGETPHLAARLQTMSSPGAVIIAESTGVFSGELFVLESLGSQLLHGFALPMQAWQVIGDRNAESRFEALRGFSPARMVGRKQELALLLDRWEQSKNGEGQVVLLRARLGLASPDLFWSCGISFGTSTASTCVCNAPHSTSTAPCGRWLNTWSVLPGWTGMHRPRPAGAASRPCSFRWSPKPKRTCHCWPSYSAYREMRAIPFSALRRSRRSAASSVC